MEFTLQQLQVFLAVVELHSTNEAARAMKLSQSTVSFHLRSLEDALGMKLFSTNQQRRELTEVGSELLHYARRLTATAAEAERVLTDYQRHRQRQLIVAASHVPATYIVPIVIQRFYETHPDVHVTVELMASPEVRNRVVNQQVDVGFIIDAQPTSSPIASIPVWQDEIGCVFSPNTGLQWLKPPITADQLSAVPLIGHAELSSTAQVCRDWAQLQGTALETITTLGSIDMMKTAVKLGMGAALLSRLMVFKEVETGELLYAPLANPPRRQLQLIYCENPERRWLNEFIQVVRQSMQSIQSNIDHGL